jgi:hypothetical protein
MLTEVYNSSLKKKKGKTSRTGMSITGGVVEKLEHVDVFWICSVQISGEVKKIWIYEYTSIPPYPFMA